MQKETITSSNQKQRKVKNLILMRHNEVNSESRRNTLELRHNEHGSKRGTTNSQGKVWCYKSQRAQQVNLNHSKNPLQKILAQV